MNNVISTTVSDFFPGDGEMVRAVNAANWQATPLGPMQEWPPCIRSAVSICLGSNFQLMVLAGPDLVYIYNDACISIFGDKHPQALGRRVADVWPEAWERIGPVLRSVLVTGEPVRQDDWPLMLNRSGFDEECFFTLSYSPVRPDVASAGSAGVFVAVMETTRRVLGERRQRTLSELAIQVALRRGDDSTFALVRQALAANLFDLPLAALYLADPGHPPGSGSFDAVFCTGLHEGCAGLMQRIAWGCEDGAEIHPLARLAATGAPQLLDFDEVLGPADTCGAWPEPPRQLIALALPAGADCAPRGFLLVALNPRAPFDDDYRQFIDTVAGLVASAVASVDAAAFEVERALATAELDRSKHDLASVLARTSDAFVSVDPELRLLTLNDAAIASLGAAREKLVGRSFVELLPATVALTMAPALRAVLAGGQPVAVEVCDPRSGRWFNVRCYPAPQGLLVFGNDITERRDAERMLMLAKRELERRFELRTEELREANQLLAAVFDRAPGGIAITDTFGCFVRANPAYQALAGVAEEALLGRTVADLTVASDYPALAAGIKALLDGAAGSAQMEVRFARADASVIWVHNFVSIIADKEGEGRARYFVHIASDITERKRVEAGRRAAQDELNVLYQRLQTVREAERTALAREVHDQLGQILSAAKIDVKLLEGDIRVHGAALAPEKIVAELHSAGATLDRAMQLVRDIATELRAPELDGQGLYAAIEWHARDFERRTRIQVHLDLGAGLAQPARAAGEALLRIFHEALTNVLRHAHAGCVWVSVERRAGALLLRVREDGDGIARQRARTMRFVGSLGIIGMRERAALAHGRFRVGPLKPRGTLVSALIPMSAPQAASFAPGAP